MVLQELNDEIYKLARMIFSRKEIASNNRKTLDIAKFNFKNNLDKKEFTNEEKRENEALRQPEIKASTEDLKQYINETSLMELEYEHKLRLFNILLGDKE